ncbi:zinc metallopeptidase [Beduinella massiliensis]|uniref:zinc metallopeptidase n=1 Tax=Beduinella massiliensis TaxID=1852363 RepID=UPI000C82B89D
MFFYDWTMIIVLPALLLALYAQSKVSSTFNRYSKVYARSGLTAAQAADAIMRQNGITDVRIERVRGNLTDHYDPRARILRLSDGVYDSTSIAALGVAAHEAGHAVQHAQGYMPLEIRNVFAPVASIGSNAAIPLFILGLLFSWEPLVTVGLVCFSFAVVFSLITLPVEFNASSRAVASLSGYGYLSQEETDGAQKVLNAAALTYVASALTAILQLARLFILSGRSRRD